jgi:hypothetical protein
MPTSLLHYMAPGDTLLYLCWQPRMDHPISAPGLDLCNTEICENVDSIMKLQG